MRTIRATNRGFTIIEIMIALLIASALGLGISNFIRSSQANMRSGSLADEIRTNASIVNKALKNDLSQIVYLNASCVDNPADPGVTTPCSDLVVRSGVTPLPDMDKAAVDALTTFAIPSNLTDDPSSLTSPNDAIRLLLFNFTSSFNCRLYADHAGSNPSTTAGSGAGAERLWARQAECDGKLNNGELYILVETIGGQTFANLFQITSPPTNLGNEIQVDLASASSSYNQIGGMGLSGFSSEARIFPVKFVEWAVDSSANLWRREIVPDAADPLGYKSWTLVQGNVDGLQFYPLTATLAGSVVTAIEHQRTMQFTADTNNNGIEDIRGVSTRFVVKGSTTTDRATNFDNPLTATVETDNIPREEFKFFVQMRNRQGG